MLGEVGAKSDAGVPLDDRPELVRGRRNVADFGEGPGCCGVPFAKALASRFGGTGWVLVSVEGAGICFEPLAALVGIVEEVEARPWAFVVLLDEDGPATVLALVDAEVCDDLQLGR